MSRDWTPRETYLMDKYFQQTKNISLRGQPITMWIKETDEKVRVDNHLATNRYPELSFLLDGFDAIYSKYQVSPAALKKLDDIELTIQMLEDDKSKEKMPMKFKDIDFICKWFNGETEDYFYSSGRNNNIFTEWLVEKLDSCISTEILKKEVDNRE